MNSDLSKKVLTLLLKIPKGKVTTYLILARYINIHNEKLGVNKTVHQRTIASIMKNNTDYKYPCYKVINSNMTIGGYNRKEYDKLKLLENDGVIIESGKISKESLFKDF